MMKLLAALALGCHYVVAAEQEACENSALQRSWKYVHQDYMDYFSEHEQPLLETLKDVDDSTKLGFWNVAKGKGVAKEHLDWMHDHAKIHCDKENSMDGFRTLGVQDGIEYEINDALTAASGGTGYFRLSGEIDIPPQMLIALVLDAKSLGEMDHTVRYMNMYRSFGDEQSMLCLWVADPGFPFQWRDGVDLTTWRKDTDGVFWQLSISVLHNIPELKGSTRAIDRYWAYKLEPVGKSRTKLTLVCQSVLNGWMPKFLVNYFTGIVLSDYVRTVEKRGKELITSGQAEGFMKQFKNLA